MAAAEGEHPPIDDRILELIELRLRDRVTERVEHTLRWRYSIVGAVFIAVAGLFGWNIRATVDAKVEQVSRAAEDQLKAQTRALTEAASKTIGEVNASLMVAETIQKRSGRLIDQIEQERGQIETRQEALATLRQRILAFQEALDAQLQELRLSSDTLGTLPSLNEDVRTLAVQLKGLEGQVSAITARLGAGAPSVPAAAPDAESRIQNVVDGARVRSEQLAIVPRNTVFLQFAGGVREQAQRLTAALRAEGYGVPGEERVATAAGKREVRFFWPEDKIAAEKLARDAGAALARLDFGSGPVRAVDLTTFPGAKPRQGTLELWIEIPPGRRG
ncbi:MAG: hypothetical protein AB7O45_13045 [Alphaproteobacteria bacterium]